MNEIVVLSTAESMDTALKIARAVVEDGEAACVNIVPGVRSIYRWQGKLCDEGELLLIIKTTQDRFEALRVELKSLHPYDVPEVIAVPIIAGDVDYLRWLAANVAPGSDGSGGIGQ